MADPIDAGERLSLNSVFKIAQLAGGASNFKALLAGQHRNSGRIVPAILEPA
jgi:hypothetical protein